MAGCLRLMEEKETNRSDMLRIKLERNNKIFSEMKMLQCNENDLFVNLNKVIRILHQVLTI